MNATMEAYISRHVYITRLATFTCASSSFHSLLDQTLTGPFHEGWKANAQLLKSSDV